MSATRWKNTGLWLFSVCVALGLGGIHSAVGDAFGISDKLSAENPALVSLI